MSEVSPTTKAVDIAADAPKPTTSFQAIDRRSLQAARVVALLFAILVIGAGLGYYIAHTAKPVRQTTSTPQVKTLTQAEINKLSALGSSVGTTDQLLTIGATAQFNNNVIASKNLSVQGNFNANGPVTLKSLAISGSDTSINGLRVTGPFGVTGATILQNGATVGGLLSATGNLAVAGIANISTLSAGTITVKNIIISGPLTLAHLITQGQLPASSTGGAVGGSGTSSISGNDTAGTVSINVGSGSGPGTLVSVTFRQAYGANVHVLLTPLTGAAASAPVFATRTATGFQLRTDSAIAAGSFLSYDYLVVQ